MSDSDSSLVSESIALPTHAGANAGALLRTAREAQGLHIGALAVALKVPVKKLEALEANRYDLLPDLVFVRALALSVCRALKIDAEPVMAGLPQLQALKIKVNESGLNTSFKSSGATEGNSFLMRLFSPSGAVVSALLGAIALTLFWPEKGTSDEGTRPLVGAEQGPVNVASAPLTMSNSIQAEQPLLSSSDATKPPALPLAEDPSSARRSASAPAEQSNLSAASDTAAQTSVVLLEARGASWVEVTDAQGNSLLRKTLVEGEVSRLSGALPLAVVLGRADLISVSVRGKALDTTNYSKDNVARFEVK
ncbi:MAG: DUF4115 domain-containing protein [Comamonadaceae bacterium]|nr:DUF4115 domain-containing protein [Comamonadaceae bacterium]